MHDKFANHMANIPNYNVWGKVSAIKDAVIECVGIHRWVEVGSSVYIENKFAEECLCEVIGILSDKVLLMPVRSMFGVSIGAKARMGANLNVVYPDKSWLGRVINGMAEPVDGKGELSMGSDSYSIYATPPLPSKRRLVREKLDLGIRSVNTFVPCCKGQRMGIFSGSGIGKSVLLSMITRFAMADVKVIGLIGERGREVGELLDGALFDHRENAIVVVATGDESALMRKHASYLVLSICEYFRDQGLEVLCLLDSISRFAMAQREIGLFLGEIPTVKGYTPSVFAHLSRLLERAGSGIETQGNITGLFSVLVENDDYDSDPIADCVRSILDGHLILDREIAERGRFPAVNILRSVSRVFPLCNSEEQNKIVMEARKLLARYESVRDMIDLGIYKKGSDAKIDKAIIFSEKLENFCAQDIDECCDIPDSYAALSAVLDSV